MRPARATQLVAALLLAQRSGAQQYDLRTLSLEEGLPSAGTFALCEDRDGFLWVGTMQGAARSAGLRFEAMVTDRGRGDDQVTALACAPDGAVWIGSGNGAVSVWRDGTLAPTAAQRSGHAVRAFVGTAHGMWWATAGAGVLFSSDGGARCVARNAGLRSLVVHALVAQANGTLIAGTDSGLFVLRRQRWEPASSNALLPGEPVNALYADSTRGLLGRPCIMRVLCRGGRGAWSGARNRASRAGVCLIYVTEYASAPMPGAS